MATPARPGLASTTVPVGATVAPWAMAAETAQVRVTAIFPTRTSFHRLPRFYCSQPNYTDEARKAKLEGPVLLRVLVARNGKPQRIQILQGLGMGLDERTEETIRTWRFSPGRDANKNPVATWVTIETRFQL